MGYHGAKLANVFKDEPAKVATHQIAEDVSDFMLAAVVALTPEDTGHLKGSWKKKPLTPTIDWLRRGVAWETGVETSVEYAPYVEYGTGLYGPRRMKYEIRPKKPGGWLHWTDKAGEDHFARVVWHPGSKGQHMVARTLTLTENGLGFIGEDGTLLWRQLQTAVWDKEAARARVEVAAARFR